MKRDEATGFRQREYTPFHRLTFGTDVVITRRTPLDLDTYPLHAELLQGVQLPFGVSADTISRIIAAYRVVPVFRFEVVDMPAKLPDSYRNHIIRLYQSGLTQRQIAVQQGRDQKWVGSVLRSAGVSRSNSQGQRLSWENGRVAYQLRTDLDSTRIAIAYQAGASMCQLAEQSDSDRKAVRRRILEAGVPIRSADEAYALIDRKKAATLRAESRPENKIGWGEELFRHMLVERGENPDSQFPVGTKNIDLAVHPVAVEIWLSSTLPFDDPYCSERIK